MPTYSYTEIADYILDQLWGFASANSLKNSLRYIAEDILGSPHENSDAIVPSSTSANNIIDAYTRTTGTSVGKRGVAISDSSGSASRTAQTFADVTNLSVTITTSGRPVLIMLIPDGDVVNGSQVMFTESGAGESADVAHFKILRDATEIVLTKLSSNTFGSGATTVTVAIPPAAISAIDTPAAGTYVYKLQYKVEDGDASEQVNVFRCRLAAFEL